MRHLGKSPKTDNLYNLGKARSASGPSSPPDPNAYTFYINSDGDLIMVYRAYKPEYEIRDGDLYTSETDVYIDEKGYLIKEVN